MKTVLKVTIFFVLNILLYVGMWIGVNENKKKDDARYQAIVKAFEEVNEGFRYQQELISEQNKLIEQYKRDCENITSKVINKEW